MGQPEKKVLKNLFCLDTGSFSWEKDVRRKTVKQTDLDL